MNHKLKGMLGAIGALLCAFCLPHQASAQALPDGKGKAEFVHNCTACHRASLVIAVKKTPEEWKKSVFEMADRGTDGTKEDLDKVVFYLDTFFASDNPAPVGATPPPTPASTSGSPSPQSSKSECVKPGSVTHGR